MTLPLIKQTIIIDLITTLWIVAIFIALFLWLPIKSSYFTIKKIDDRDNSHFIGFWLRIIFIIITGSLSLSYLHLLNWLTLTLLYGSCLIFNYLASYNWQVKSCQQVVQDRIYYLPLFSTLAAVVSLLGSIDPMQVIRFLSPILGIIMVLSVGYIVRIVTNNASSALVAMLGLGVYLFTWEQGINPELPEWLTRLIESLNGSLIRQWTGNELELGTIFVLLSLGYYFDADKQQNDTTKTTFIINIICGIILVAMSAPPLLILVAIAGIGVIGGKRSTLTAIALTWIILAVFAAVTKGQLLWTQSFLLTLPVALSLLAGLAFTAIAEVVKLLSNKWAETFCLAVILSLSINFLLPLPPNLTYLEYDMAARKSLELKNLFPPQNWTLAAPPEQLAEIYGSGWYEDLALFVEKYADRASNPEFNFPVSGRDLFIFVEKIPFVTFANEPSVLPNSILGDRTYRYYRSSAGRASLEFEALKMCEAYRRNHPNSEIYYEDQELRIYHFQV